MKLFLDDIRNPIDVYNYILRQKIYLENDWAIVRSYDEFVAYIKQHGLPTFVSFGHDLTDGHYSADYTDERTGYDCAKFLLEYCNGMDVEVPPFNCHSMNPIGKERIINLLCP
jgi:hypothetical protein